jgi:hypothetical protein
VTKTYKIVNNVVVETNVVETPFAGNQTGAGFPTQSFPSAPSIRPFPFVQPQVGAIAIPAADDDNQVMPASNDTGLYYFSGATESSGPFRDTLKWWNADSQSWGVITTATDIPGTGYDLNTFMTDGVFKFQWGTASYQNTPPGIDFFHGILEVFTMYGYVCQRVFAPYVPDKIFQRAYTTQPEGASPGTPEWSHWFLFQGSDTGS